MRQFKEVLRFELAGFMKNRGFVGVTVLLVAVLALTMFFPRFTAALESDETAERPLMLVEGAEADVFAAAFPDYRVEAAEKVQEKVASGEAACAFRIEGPTAYTYYVLNRSMYDVNTTVAEEVLRSSYRLSAMVAGGMSPDTAAGILSAPVEGRTECLGQDQGQNFFYTYVMIFALYIVIAVYGQLIATRVAAEKSSRAMELLITSATPNAMMFGKVIAACVAGLVQMVAVFGAALLFYHLNADFWGGNEIMQAIFDMPVELFGFMLLFFVLGFFFYAFLYGAIGSTVSRMEDISPASMPVTLLFVISFFVVMFSMLSGSVDTVLMKICSYVPFTAPMAIFARLAMSQVASWEVLVSVGVQLLSILGSGVLSAKIYRTGVLRYGNAPKLPALFRTLRKA